TITTHSTLLLFLPSPSSSSQQSLPVSSHLRATVVLDLPLHPPLPEFQWNLSL
ncbi:hypothetical protein S83_066140, partial [Arachis hypogaea]